MQGKCKVSVQNAYCALNLGKPPENKWSNLGLNYKQGGVDGQYLWSLMTGSYYLGPASPHFGGSHTHKFEIPWTRCTEGWDATCHTYQPLHPLAHTSQFFQGTRRLQISAEIYLHLQSVKPSYKGVELTVSFSLCLAVLVFGL